ncbi:unnamed protein product [Trichogramma brassicae]|uniref:Uncharacterized protein n=1 Tax=Trichogramma brassicae TaxID=86971 RepID=A0A6H5I722_9HYME|nr:unnamed protein product [Trichogramma brassicae]
MREIHRDPLRTIEEPLPNFLFKKTSVDARLHTWCLALTAASAFVFSRYKVRLSPSRRVDARAQLIMSYSRLSALHCLSIGYYVPRKRKTGKPQSTYCTYACIEIRVEVGPHEGSTSASLGIVGRVRKSLPPYRLCVNQRSAKDCLSPRTICVAAPRDTFADESTTFEATQEPLYLFSRGVRVLEKAQLDRVIDANSKNRVLAHRYYFLSCLHCNSLLKLADEREAVHSSRYSFQESFEGPLDQTKHRELQYWVPGDPKKILEQIHDPDLKSSPFPMAAISCSGARGLAHVINTDLPFLFYLSKKLWNPFDSLHFSTLSRTRVSYLFFNLSVLEIRFNLQQMSSSLRGTSKFWFRAKTEGASLPPVEFKSSEGWHNRFSFIVGKHHPDLYSLLKELQKERGDTESAIAEFSLGKAVKAALKLKWIQLQERLKTIALDYERFKNDDKLEDYLRLMGYQHVFINFLIGLKLLNSYLDRCMDTQEMKGRKCASLLRRADKSVARGTVAASLQQPLCFVTLLWLLLLRGHFHSIGKFADALVLLARVQRRRRAPACRSRFYKALHICEAGIVPCFWRHKSSRGLVRMFFQGNILSLPSTESLRDARLPRTDARRSLFFTSSQQWRANKASDERVGVMLPVACARPSTLRNFKYLTCDRRCVDLKRSKASSQRFLEAHSTCSCTRCADWTDAAKVPEVAYSQL